MTVWPVAGAVDPTPIREVQAATCEDSSPPPRLTALSQASDWAWLATCTVHCMTIETIEHRLHFSLLIVWRPTIVHVRWTGTWTCARVARRKRMLVAVICVFE